MAEIQRRLRRELVLPPQTTLEFAGLYAQQQSSFRGLLGVVLGAIMMVGIVSENGYFLLAAQRTFQREGMTTAAAAHAAARRRTRPVLTTMLAGIAALAPLAVGFGAGSELLRPLAIAVVGGFMLSAPLLLIVLPSLLARFGTTSD